MLWRFSGRCVNNVPTRCVVPLRSLFLPTFKVRTIRFMKHQIMFIFLAASSEDRRRLTAWSVPVGTFRGIVSHSTFIDRRDRKKTRIVQRDNPAPREGRPSQRTTFMLSVHGSLPLFCDLFNLDTVMTNLSSYEPYIYKVYYIYPYPHKETCSLCFKYILCSCTAVIDSGCSGWRMKG